MLEKSAQAGQHSYKERGVDCYETPPQAVHALLKVEKLPKVIWEPACGPGSIVKVLRSAGYAVYGSDVHDYGNGNEVLDFFTCERSFRVSFDAIVTNPPYQFAAEFVVAALNSAPLVIMLLRLAFLESNKRTRILEHSGLARVHVFRNRLPFMHRKNWAGPRSSSAIPFAWFCWERGYKGPTVIDRISWEKD